MGAVLATENREVHLLVPLFDDVLDRGVALLGPFFDVASDQLDGVNYSRVGHVDFPVEGPRLPEL